jgi:protein gp37
MGKTKIEWTSHVWNPVRGCLRVSPGCEHCYAETMARRFPWGQPYVNEQGRWNGKVELVPHLLDVPLRWREPRTIFVNSTSDLFHESLTDLGIAKVFGVMAEAPQHTFLVLTKRAERMCQWSEWALSRIAWALPNVWLGVSAESQEWADKRIPLLLQTPAAHRFVSLEPLLGPINLRHLTDGTLYGGGVRDALSGYWNHEPLDEGMGPFLDQVIVGGESGPGARECRVEWIRSIIKQCKAAGVPCFVKQDSGPRPGTQGRIPDDLWAVKELAWNA